MSEVEALFKCLFQQRKCVLFEQEATVWAGIESVSKTSAMGRVEVVHKLDERVGSVVEVLKGLKIDHKKQNVFIQAKSRVRLIRALIFVCIRTLSGGLVSKQTACNWLLSTIVISANVAKSRFRMASFSLKILILGEKGIS